jgi:hypothetical protein
MRKATREESRITIPDSSHGCWKFPPSPLLEIVTLLPMAGMYLYNSWRFNYPAGYAGLYALMAEILARKPFPLPNEIPFYGPGGIPFAYPPVALYIAAFFIGPLHIPMLTYMKWAPAFFCILVMVAVYLIGQKLMRDRIKALVAVVIIFSAEPIYAFHATASGSVRSIALLWTILCAYFSLRIYETDRRELVHASIAGTFLALTAMTHLSYVAFLVPGIVLMAFLLPTRKSLLLRLRTMVEIGVIGLVLAAPWWGTVIARYGPVIFLNAGSTHGTGGLVAAVGASPLALVRGMLRWYINLGRTWWPPILSGVFIVSVAYGLMQRRWLLPAWIMVTLLSLGQTERFEILLCGLLAGELLVDLSRFASQITQWPKFLGRENVGGLVFLALSVGPIGMLGFRGIQWTEVELSNDLVEVGRWIDKHTQAEARYLFLGMKQDAEEWFPYLSHRTPGISPWGAEWTGHYNEQMARMGELRTCISAQEASCVNQFIESLGEDIAMLIVPVDSIQLRDDLVDSTDLFLLYENSGFIVYQRLD